MISALLLAFGVQLVSRVNRHDPAIRAWTWGAGECALGFVLIGLRDHLPDLLSIVIGNTLIVIGAAWSYIGLRRFLNLADGPRWDVLAGLVMVPSFLHFTYLEPSLALRIVIVSALTALFNLVSARLLLFSTPARADPDRVVLIIMGVALLACGLVGAVRMVMTPLAAEGEVLNDLTGTIHRLIFLCIIGLNIVLTFGLTHLVAIRIERHLRASETKLRMALDLSPNAVFILGGDGRFLYANRQAEHLLGYPQDELVGMQVPAIVLAEQQEAVMAAFRLTLAGTQQFLESRLVRKDGEEVETEIHGVLLPDATALLEVSDITERKRVEIEIRHLAYYDSLTHLPNRRLLMDRLGQARVAGKRSREFGALMILDLDHFKQLNDTRGHDIGDRLLVEVALRLSACVREKDTVSRLGGDEYVVLLEGLGLADDAAVAQAEHIAEKIAASLRRPYHLDDGQPDYHCSTSIGLTLFQGDQASAEALLKQADVALYQAKDAGRDAIRFFNPAMQAAIDTRTALDASLRRGLEQGEFQLDYQPQVDGLGRLIGAEALIRWQSTSGERHLPATFMPQAEASGLILLLGRWVLDTACAQLHAWGLDSRTRGLQVSVNVSARQFLQADFVEQVAHSLQAAGADPSRLKLELTESVVLGHVEEVIERMTQLDVLGVCFSLDDFGTGYTSLSHLKRLPLKQIKIDPSFVQDVARDADAVAIVRAIMALCQSLGLQAIAEGVETPAQREILLAEGCRMFQGNLFGHPGPAATIEHLARAGFRRAQPLSRLSAAFVGTSQ